MKPQKKILLIDDQFGDINDPRHESFIDTWLPVFNDEPYKWFFESGCIGSGELKTSSLSKVRKAVHDTAPDLLLLDIRFPEDDVFGLEILSNIRKELPVLPVIIFTTFGRDSFPMFSQCIMNGANEFIQKDRSQLKMMKEILKIWLFPNLAKEHTLRPLYGNSESIKELRMNIAKVAYNNSYRLKEPAPILINGETGTGKEVIANMLWRLGKRADKTMQIVECVGLSSTLIESELFGYIKGAFTGATSDREGIIKQADGGTLFLDEVGDLPMQAQEKLLRAIQEKQIRKVGSTEWERVDFQLITATNQDLAKLVEKGKFRQDLYYRLMKGAYIQAPSLRDHLEDVPLLAEMFLRDATEGNEKFTSRALKKLTGHDWPGNVRELDGVITRALLFLESGISIDSDDIFFEPASKSYIFKGDIATNNINTNDINWARERILAELRILLNTKQKLKGEGKQSTASWMRMVYPNQKKTSTEVLKAAIKRLTDGPWSSADWKQDEEITQLIEEILK